MIPSSRLGCGRTGVGACTGVDAISGFAHSGVSCLTCVSGIGGALSADSRRLSTSSFLVLPFAAALGFSTASRSSIALSSAAELLRFLLPESSFSSLSMNLSSPCLTGGGGAAAAAVSSLGETSLDLPLLDFDELPDESSSESVGSATSPPRLLVCGFGAAASLAACASAFSFSFAAFSAAALLIACARAILSSSARLSSGPITESSHCICLLMTLSSLSESPDFAFLLLGSAARAAGDQEPKAQVPTSAAQRRNLDRIGNDLHVGGGGIRASIIGACGYLTSAFLAVSPSLSDVDPDWTQIGPRLDPGWTPLGAIRP